MAELSLIGVLLRRALAAMGGPVGKFISAVTVGIIGSVGLVTYSPQIILDTNKIRDAVFADQAEVQRIARPDPWRGEQGRENRRMAQDNSLAIERLRAKLDAVVKRAEALERAQVINDLHIAESKDGFRRIRALENRASRLEAQIEELIYDQRLDRRGSGN